MDRHDLWVTIDILKRKSFIKFEIKRKILKSVKRSHVVPIWRRYYSSYLLTKLPRITSKTISSNRCVISGRVWSVNKKTNYNRFIFRTETYSSNIPGCSRASW